VLEARDLNHAVELVSQHPGLKFGPWERVTRWAIRWMALARRRPSPRYLSPQASGCWAPHSAEYVDGGEDPLRAGADERARYSISILIATWEVASIEIRTSLLPVSQSRDVRHCD
jgi:hypothetical protein